MESLFRNYILHHLSEVDSTNLHASALLSVEKSGAPLVITAEYQTHGKGQGGSRWESARGLNLLVSIAIVPVHIRADEQFYLSKITSLAIRELISDRVRIKGTTIKWPNDILFGKEKISGILIENALEGTVIRNSVIGAGININQTEFAEFPLKATSLRLVTGKEIPVSLILKEFIRIFDYWYEVLENRDFQQIDKSYMSHLYGYQQLHTFRKGNKLFRARIADVKNDGRLVLQLGNNTRQKFLFREISLELER
jgi:BirA family biotin operon repressor/biotin-[acetyl-CoA-carboxylase] ligase